MLNQHDSEGVARSLTPAFSLMFSFHSKLSVLARKTPGNSGMTVLELLIGLVVAGGIVAIAVPTVKHQQAKAQERQSRSYLQTLTQAQKQHYTLHQSFAKSPEALELKDKSKTAQGYDYSIDASKDGRVVTHKARSRSRALRSQVSVVSLQGGNQIDSLLCEATDPDNLILGNGKLVGGQLLCPEGYRPLQ